MRFRGAMVLFILSLLLGGGYLFYVVPHSTEKKMITELSQRFFRIDPEQVEFIRIMNPKGAFDLAWKEQKWKITSPEALETDEKTMTAIVDIIRKGRILKVISGDMPRAAEFGLERPSMGLAVGFRGRIDELSLGSLNPANTGYYAYAKGIRTVFLVDKEIEKALNVGLYDLRAKALFSFSPDKVTRVRLSGRNGEIELTRNSAGWEVTRPMKGDASNEAVNAFLMEVLNQRAEEFFDGHVPSAKDYIDSVTLLIDTPEAPPVSIRIYYAGTAAGQGAVAYQTGMKSSGRLARDFWNFVNRNASSFRYRNLFRFEENDVAAIEVKKDGAGFRLDRRGKEWVIEGKVADSRRANELLWFLKSWTAAGLLDKNAQRKGEGNPSVEITLHNREAIPLGQLRVYEKLEGKVLGYIGKEQNVMHYAVSATLPSPAAVSSMDIGKIPGRKELLP